MYVCFSPCGFFVIRTEILFFPRHFISQEQKEALLLGPQKHLLSLFPLVHDYFIQLKIQKANRRGSISPGSSISHATAPDIHYGARDEGRFDTEKEVTSCIII